MLAFKSLQDDARPLVNFPVFRISNAAINSVFVNVYQQEPDTEITAFTRPLSVALSPGLDTSLFTSNPGTWDFTLTNFGEIEPIAPVLRVDMVPGEIIEFAILDTVDPGVFELFEFSRQ